MRKRRSIKGETLIETIVSFAVVLLTLVTITAVVQLCIRLNNRAMEKAEALELAAAAIEEGAAGAAERGQMRLTLPNGSTVTIPIDVYRGELLSYFEAEEEP